ncbi:tyrosine recombinase [Roseovarius salis]|uniref:site-specific tyrosine recombinase XerD n=1 Tax=Roseovarius salis TaxID=3376063 RepID=UPI0037C9AE9E
MTGGAGWIQPFLEARAAELGASRNTLSAYARDLGDFADWLNARGKDAETAGQADIEAYLVHCDAQGLARSTRARRLSAIRQFYAFAFEEGLRGDNPALQVSGPTPERKLPKTLSEQDVDRLLDAARRLGRDEADRVRNTCLMELLYATGMRVSELISLPVAAARGRPELLLVTGKGGKERMVPLSATAQGALSAWLTVRDRAEERGRAAGRPASPFLFPSRGRTGHLTRHRFYLLVKELAVEAGISPGDVTPHTLRHAFATHLLANGADLRAIQTLLGHADVATTEIYTHVLDERLKSLVEDHHPLARRHSGAHTPSDEE